jgi:glycosyltransferase involved in cell wall biosynthesis
VPPLRIGIEAHVVGSRPSGNGRVVANLISALAEGFEHELFVYFTDPHVAKDWGRRDLSRVTVRLIRPAHPFVRIPFGLPLRAARDGLDVFLAHDNRPPFSPCPVVTLVHDVAFARHPEFFSPYERAWMARTIPASMRRSAGVVTVSGFTRDEMVDLYGIRPEKITVAHNGVDPLFLDPTPRPALVEPPFVLAVGNLQPRKNLATLIAAYRALVAAHPDTAERLVIVGQRGYAAEVLVEGTKDLLAAGRVVFPGYLPDQDLIGLLQRATAFAYPSVYEGFGLPPLEAMAVGSPTLVADIPVMREVVDDAAMRLPATDVPAWTEALRRVIADPDLRGDLSSRGRKRASGFTWERSASAVAGALERAAARR